MKPSSDPLSGLVQSDDVASLMEHLNDHRFEYVDTAALRAHEEVLQRWPLVRELSRTSSGIASNSNSLAAKEPD